MPKNKNTKNADRPGKAGKQTRTAKRPSGKPNGVPDRQDAGDRYGVLSIVIAFIGFQIIGLIIGLVGASKAKKEGRSPTLSRIGWILNLVIIIAVAIYIGLILAGTSASAAQRHRDKVRHRDVERLYTLLNKHHDHHGYYPADLATLGRAEGTAIPAKDPAGRPYRYTAMPSGCTECTSYQLSASLESGYTRTIDSLHR